MAYQTAKIRSVIGNVIQIENPAPLGISSLLTSAASAAGVTLTVADNSGFQFGATDALPDLLLIGTLGVDQTEIKKINGAITLGTSLTISALTFPHAVDTSVAKYLFDQVEISGASSATGNKTVIDTMSLQVGAPVTTFIVSGTTYSYYFVRYYNSQATTPYYSAYSAATPAVDYTFGSVKPAIDEAYRMVNDTPSEFYSLLDCYAAINNCYSEIIAERKKWSWRFLFDYNLGEMTSGTWSVSLPTDMADRNTYKSIMGVRLGKQSDMAYLDKSEWDKVTTDVAYSTLAQPAGLLATGTFTDDSPAANSIAWATVTITSGGTTYTITDGNTSNTYVWLDTAVSTTVFQTSNTLPSASSTIVYLVKNDAGAALVCVRVTSSVDFDDTGSFSVEDDDMQYTDSNNRTSGFLIGVTGQTAEHSSGAYIFQGANTGEPCYWTIINNTLLIYPVVGTEFTNRNLYIDYAKGVTVVAADTDSLLFPDYMLVSYYIAWKYLLRKNNGNESEGSLAMKKSYRDRVDMLKRNEVSGQYQKFRPRTAIWQNYTFLSRRGPFFNEN
jgi:hypothetical protein